MMPGNGREVNAGEAATGDASTAGGFPPSSGDKQVYTVSQAFHLIRSVLKDDPDLASLWVFGEISGLFCSGAGHRYFSVKDDKSQLKCVLFAGEGVNADIEDGSQVILGAAVDMYRVKGELQLRVMAVEPLGQGLLFQRFLELRKRLENEGLFADGLKRRPPAYPRVVGVATSEDGAALQDVVNVLSRRSPWVRLVLAHTPVQGSGAVDGITSALDLLYRRGGLDCILLVRGGGSFEDLAAFSEEPVVRKVRESPVPLITGVGHRTDVNLCDMAADLMAPTPSAAAEQCCGDIGGILETMALRRRSIEHSLASMLDRREMAHHLAVERIRRYSPLYRHAEHSQRQDDGRARLDAALDVLLRPLELRLTALSTRLTALSPAMTLSRGFSIVRSADGSPATSVTMLREGQMIDIVMSDGEAGAKVTKVRKGGGTPGSPARPADRTSDDI